MTKKPLGVPKRTDRRQASDGDPTSTLEAARLGALQAAAECRDATREAHLAAQGHKDLRAAAADLRTAITEAREFFTGEIKRQIYAASPATTAELDARVAEVTARFEELLAEYAPLTEDTPPPPRQEEPAIPGMTCPYCGAFNDRTAGISGAGGKPPDKPPVPRKGSISVCAGCLKVAVYDLDASGCLSLREPNKEEAKHIARSRLVQKTITAGYGARIALETARALEERSEEMPRDRSADSNVEAEGQSLNGHSSSGGADPDRNDNPTTSTNGGGSSDE